MLLSQILPLFELNIAGQSILLQATRYYDPAVPPKATLLYFHGGGLLYGTRNDLPLLHQETFTQAGFEIMAYDYPLAPYAKIDTILQAVLQAVQGYLSTSSLPFFLFGRSAGAYLALLAGAKLTSSSRAPCGILSYYGYGFLTEGWFEQANPHYLTFPPPNAATIVTLTETLLTEAPLASHYSLYVFARQTGKWKSLFYQGRDKFFYSDYTLRLHERFMCPLFFAHSTADPDVPFAEFQALNAKYTAESFVISSAQHDFDRDENSPQTAALLRASVAFLDRCLPR